MEDRPLLKGDAEQQPHLKQAAYARAARRQPLSVEEIAFFAQYFAVGIVSGGLPSTIYGLFLGYLNVEAYVYATAATIVSLPWSFKFAFGMVNDCVPIRGYRRKPYMVIGWSVCTLCLLVLHFRALPDPYWCVDAAGKYVRETKDPTTGQTVAATPCNAAAAESGGAIAMLMMLASLGYCIADVAADGLTVSLARAEPEHRRGRTQTTVYLVRTCGQVFAVALVGFGMNGYLYNGTFARGLSFPAIVGLLALPAFAMVPLSLLVRERRLSPKDEERWTFAAYCARVWRLLSSRAMLWVVLYEFCTPLVGGISTTAAGEVKEYWADVKTFQNACFSLVGLGLFAFGLWLVKTYLLDRSWRHMMLVTTVFLNCLDMPFAYCTIFDVVRNQYFYLGETVLAEIPAAANFVVSTFVIVEMAEDGDEGIVYGLLTTTFNLGSPFAQAISNQLFGLFRPNLSNSSNYIEDTPSFRRTVALSFAVSYFFAFASLALLPLLPDQKDDAQHRKLKWGSSPAFAWFSVSLVFVGLSYSVVVNFLAMFPSTMCLKIAGGSGC